MAIGSFCNRDAMTVSDVTLVQVPYKMEKYIDVIIPRGGKNLVKKVLKLCSVPIIGHLEGICHTYIDKESNINSSKTAGANGLNDSLYLIFKFMTDCNCGFLGSPIIGLLPRALGPNSMRPAK